MASDLGRRRVLRYDMACGLAPGRGRNERLQLGPVRHMNRADKVVRRLLGWNDSMAVEEIIDRGIGIALSHCGDQNIGFLQDPVWGPRLISNAISSVAGTIAGVSETGHEWRYAAELIRKYAPRTRTREQRLALLTGFSMELCSPLRWREICPEELYHATGFSGGRLSATQEIEETERLIKSCILALCQSPAGEVEEATRNRLRAVRRSARNMFIRQQGGTTNLLWQRRAQTGREIADELEKLMPRGKLAEEFLSSIRTAEADLRKILDRRS